jgi:type I restriction enzyme M protein
VRADVIEVMLALPGQLFLNTPIEVCVWFLTKDKTAHGRDRRGETLFIDARQLGTMESKVNRVLTAEDIEKIADTVHTWRANGATDKPYEDVPGFCKSATLTEIEKSGFRLTPGRYVGALEVDEDLELFDEKIRRLTSLLREQQAEGQSLDAQIRANMKRLGYEY